MLSLYDVKFNEIRDQNDVSRLALYEYASKETYEENMYQSILNRSIPLKVLNILFEATQYVP